MFPQQVKVGTTILALSHHIVEHAYFLASSRQYVCATIRRCAHQGQLLKSVFSCSRRICKTRIPLGIQTSRASGKGITAVASTEQVLVLGSVARHTSSDSSESNIVAAAVAAVTASLYAVTQNLRVHCDSDASNEPVAKSATSISRNVAESRDWLTFASDVPVSPKRERKSSERSDGVIGAGARRPSEVELTDDVALVILAGKKALMHGDFPLAERKFRAAVDQLGMLNPNSTAIVVLLTRIGNLCYAQHKWEAAVDALSAAVRGLVLQVGRDRTDPSVVELSLKISDCLSRVPGRFADATDGYLWCVMTAREHVAKHGIMFGPRGTGTNSVESDTATQHSPAAPPPNANADTLTNDLAMLGMTLQAAVDHLQLQRDHPVEKNGGSPLPVSPSAIVDLCVELLAVSERVEIEMAAKSPGGNANRDHGTKKIDALPADVHAAVLDAMRVALPQSSADTSLNSTGDERSVASPRMAGAHARLAAALDAAGHHTLAIVHARTALDLALRVMRTHGRRSASVHVYLVNLALLLIQGMPTGATPTTAMPSVASGSSLATQGASTSGGETTVTAQAVATLLDAAQREAHTVGDRDAVAYIAKLSAEIAARQAFDRTE